MVAHCDVNSSSMRISFASFRNDSSLEFPCRDEEWAVLSNEQRIGDLATPANVSFDKKNGIFFDALERVR